MTKVMVFNFETMQFEQEGEDEGKEWLDLMDSMNSDCASQIAAESPVAPPNFDEWCDGKRIKGNYKEALYHSLAAKFSGVDKIPQDESAWMEEWNVVLKSIMAKAMSAF